MARFRRHANAQMLDVARRKGLPVEWREGRAEALPFGDATFAGGTGVAGLMSFTVNGGAGVQAG